MRHHLAGTLAALLTTGIALVAAPATAGNGNPAGNPAGNNGTVKIAGVDDAADPSNDPHVSCTFAVEWYGFDAGSTIWSDVTFESQAPTAAASITVTSGSTHVFVGEDAAGGGTDLDHREVYTLAFSGAAQAQQGFHVAMTTDTAGSQGADKKSKVFWVSPCTPTQPTEPTEPTQPSEPTPPTPPTQPTQPTPPSEPKPPTQPVTSDPGHPTTPVVPWDWNWRYAAPTCGALTVDYPANIPDGQANDVNVRFETAQGPLTLNFHDNGGTWSGRTAFTFAAHPQWPAGLASYRVVWVQVGGTNYHWQGTVGCGDLAPAPAAQVSGFRAGTLTVRVGTAPSADWVTVARTDAPVLQLQQLRGGSWTRTSTAAIAGNGAAKVTFPRLTKRGSYQFRVRVDGTVSKTLTVRVR